MQINDIYKHKKNQVKYKIVDFCKIQENNEWIDGVVYKTLEDIYSNPSFVRSKQEFVKKFEKVNEKKYILKKSKVWIMPNEHIILLHIKDQEYLVIDTKFDYNEDSYYPCEIGEYITLNDLEVEDIDLDIEKTQLYNTFLFQSYLKSKKIINELNYDSFKN